MKKTIDFTEVKNKKNQKDKKRTYLDMMSVLLKIQKNEKLTVKDLEKLEDYCKAMKLFAGLSMMNEEARIDAYTLIGNISLLYNLDARHLLYSTYCNYQYLEEEIQFKM